MHAFDFGCRLDLLLYIIVIVVFRIESIVLLSKHLQTICIQIATIICIFILTAIHSVSIMRRHFFLLSTYVLFMTLCGGSCACKNTKPKINLFANHNAISTKMNAKLNRNHVICTNMDDMQLEHFS